MPVDAETYRSTLGLWATGVTIVTARAGSEVHGMTASDFAGVSLDPPLVLVCVNKMAHTLGVIRKGRNFCVNFLSADQRVLSDKFASKQEEWTRFEGIDCARGETGAPPVPGALASLGCEVEALHEAGDHVIIVGRVEDAVHGEGEPLLHFVGAYRSLKPQDSS